MMFRENSDSDLADLVFMYNYQSERYIVYTKKYCKLVVFKCFFFCSSNKIHRQSLVINGFCVYFYAYPMHVRTGIF